MCSDSTNTRTLASLTARRISSAYCDPGVASRGAIQHLMPCCSRLSTMALATAASCDEWLTKTGAAEPECETPASEASFVLLSAAVASHLPQIYRCGTGKRRTLGV